LLRVLQVLLYFWTYFLSLFDSYSSAYTWKFILRLLWPSFLLDSICYFYGLNIKCPSQAHVSPAGGAILKGGRNIKRWGSTGGSRSLRTCFWRLCLVAGPFLSASYLPWGEKLPTLHVLSLWCSAHHWPRNNQASHDRLNLWNNEPKWILPPFKLFLSGILVITMQK
jgi:hypothetical protein